MNKKLLLSIEEAGDILGLSRSTIYNLMGNGQLATVQIGRRRLIRAASIATLAGEPANDA